MRGFFRFLCKSFFFFTFLGLVASAGFLGWVYYLVTEVPCPEMEPENIASILGRESPVYYHGGQEKIGVLFEDIHRQYLQYNQIPEKFIKAIIAAEDDQFFHHYGIDFYGIARAAIANFKAGKIVQGGSTITQQTAKNLFKRAARNYEAKLKEMLYALRLEYRFSKEEILEFYCNQFYVSGNGHGLGVAARYYFDKEPADLTLLEAAFIAGSVKQPNFYNPFIKEDKVSTLKAKLRAEERAEYVLGKMLKQGMISQAEYDAAVNGEIMFNQGKTSFALNTIMDLVKEGLSSDVITDALSEHGIDNISTSGARIITTVDHALQTETLYSLRRELSRLDVRLRGYERKETQEEYRKRKGDSEIREKGFLFGRIKKINKEDPEHPVITVSFGPKQSEGFIDRQGLERMLVALVKYRKNRWAKPEKKDLAELLSRLQTGDRVYVSVREVDFFDGTPTLELERYPVLQGAALVLQHGMIRAMAGGVENRFFNRAVSAKRVMGSTFKPFLFAAALQLGWTPLDRLDNRRNAFVFMGQPYFPRPDHKSPFSHVSLSWAGVKSENVAAVWLLYHLTDRLNPAKLREVAAVLDMAPRIKGGKTENYQQFSSRIRDRFGIRISSGVLDRAAYEQALRRMEPDFVFDGRTGEYQSWKRIPYGLDFGKFRSALYQALKKKKLDSRERSEYWSRISMLYPSYLQLSRVQRRLLQHRKYIEELPVPWFGSSFFSREELQETEEKRPKGFFAENNRGKLVYTLRSKLPKSWRRVEDLALRRRLIGLFSAERKALWANILLEGTVTTESFRMVQRQMREERQALAQHKNYSMEVLTAVSDYRVMVGLQYLIRLARESGINSPLAPVLSFPLGSNVVSLLDSVRMYETLVTGKNYTVQLSEGQRDEESVDSLEGLAIIERIEAADGRIVYARDTTARPVLDRKTSNELSSILQNVIRYGTGRYAAKNVRLRSDNEERNNKLSKMDLPLPLMGKTGTANDFRNAAFFGYVPTGTAESALLADAGYAVGVYTGFDDNDPMKKGTTRISGAQGALPTWSSIAEYLYTIEGVADRLDPVDLAFDGIALKYPDTGQYFVPVRQDNGGLMSRGKAGIRSVIAPPNPAVLGHGSVSANGSFEAERRFIPFWLNQQP
ncbi:MAG: transglycosylase domain-containing protein [Candidatus Electrothrix sp. YB6]